MTNYLKTTAAIGALAFAATQASAVPISGTINFAGSNDITLVGGATFPTATGVHFTGGTPNAFVISTQPVLGTDTFAANGVVPLTLATFKDFNFGAAVPALWTIGTFTFDLTAAANNSVNDLFLTISGTGKVKSTIAGLDETDGFFTLTSSRSEEGQTSFSWQSSTSTARPPTGTPDGGATLTLLGLAVAGLGAASKLRR